jgi:YLP motif-containing protein 1
MILRGPPGSGKSFLANLIKQEEEKFVSASEKPKILSIDNYFISEQETVGSSNKKLPDHQIVAF